MYKHNVKQKGRLEELIINMVRSSLKSKKACQGACGLVDS